MIVDVHLGTELRCQWWREEGVAHTHLPRVLALEVTDGHRDRGVGLAPVFHLFFVGPGGAFVAAAHPRLSLENTFPRLTFYRTALPAKLG